MNDFWYYINITLNKQEVFMAREFDKYRLITLLDRCIEYDCITKHLSNMHRDNLNWRSNIKAALNKYPEANASEHLYGTDPEKYIAPEITHRGRKEVASGGKAVKDLLKQAVQCDAQIKRTNEHQARVATESSEHQRRKNEAREYLKHETDLPSFDTFANGGSI